MIKRMETDSMGIEITEDKIVLLTVEKRKFVVDVDGLKQLRDLIMHFWDANSLYQFTSEEIAERERWAIQDIGPLTAQGRSPFASDHE